MSQLLKKLAPTGCSASNILGETIDGFVTKVGKWKPSIDQELKKKIKSELEYVCLLIIDEKSMIGKDKLHRLSDILNQSLLPDADSNSDVVFFGGLNVLICGS